MNPSFEEKDAPNTFKRRPLVICECVSRSTEHEVLLNQQPSVHSIRASTGVCTCACFYVATLLLLYDDSVMTGATQTVVDFILKCNGTQNLWLERLTVL